MLSLLSSFFQHGNVLTDEIFQVLEGSRESLEEVMKDPKIEQYGISQV